ERRRSSTFANKFPPRLGQAYAIAFQLLNMVEENVAAQARRQRSMPGAYQAETGLWSYNFKKLKDLGLNQQEITKFLPQVKVAPVLTAHPTEAKRQIILEQHRELYLLLVELENQMWTPYEQQAIRSQIKVALERLWRTGEVILAKPEVSKERETVLHYLCEVFPSVLHRLDLRLSQAWEKAGFTNQPMDDVEKRPDLRFGTWVGGDRDGHPFVTAEVTASSLEEYRSHALLILQRQLSELPHKICLNSRYQPPPESITQGVKRMKDLVGERPNGPTEQFPQETWRQYAGFLHERLPIKLVQGKPQIDERPGTYQFPAELVKDLQVLSKALNQAGASQMAKADITPIIRSLKVFGFHLAAMDVRQNSAFHDKAIGQIMSVAGLDGEDFGDWTEKERLNFLLRELRSPRPFLHDRTSVGPEADAVLDCYRVLTRHLDTYGIDGVGSLIISMTQRLSDLLVVYILAREAGLAQFGKNGLYCRVPVVPLFETLEDLRRAPEIMQAFFEHPVTTNTMRWRMGIRKKGEESITRPAPRPTQQIMIGYSDSNKDAGIMASQWSLHRCQQSLTRIAEERGVNLRFFHGRGGTISRGAGPTHRFLEALPHASLGGDIRVTEQGETIAQKYANQITATYNLELLLAGVTGTTLIHRHGETNNHHLEPIAEKLCESSAAGYRKLLQSEGFIEFYTQTTPLDALENSRIGSRPSRRTGAKSLEDLRAIPWVFSWNQSRYYLPGWFGVGSALQALKKESPKEFSQLKKEIHSWHFMLYVLTNVETNIASVDSKIIRDYAGLVENEVVRKRFLREITSEYQLSRKMINEVFGGSDLEKRRPRMVKTLQQREAGLNILHQQQIQLLKKWRGLIKKGKAREANTMLPDLLLSINAIASGLRTTG
ncbi:MAG: phosphoenolpyruvate carboxylase, partial [Verrucomicrobiota bacterium]